MDRLAIRAIHYAALGKAKSLLIKSHGCLYVGYRKHGRYRSVVFLIEGINLLCHGVPFGEPRHISTDPTGQTSQQYQAVYFQLLCSSILEVCLVMPLALLVEDCV